MGARLCCWDLTDFALGLDGMFHEASVKEAFPAKFAREQPWTSTTGEGDHQIWNSHFNDNMKKGVQESSHCSPLSYTSLCLLSAATHWFPLSEHLLHI